jgi:hypothetical protein
VIFSLFVGADQLLQENRWIILLVFVLISALLHARIPWKTSMISVNQRLSVVHYADPDKRQGRSQLIEYQYLLFALFLGFQEGYLFANLLKVSDFAIRRPTLFGLVRCLVSLSDALYDRSADRRWFSWHSDQCSD